MLHIDVNQGVRHCDGLTRRDLLRVGALGLGGLTLPALLQLQQTTVSASPPPRRQGRSVIVLFLSGGPSQLDMFDLKPEAPLEIRGTFRPTATRVPGVHISEHLPRMAAQADKYTIIRSMRHNNGNHPAAAYWMMVGSPMTRPAPQIVTMSREDRPHPGSVIARLFTVLAGMAAAFSSWCPRPFPRLVLNVPGSTPVSWVRLMTPTASTAIPILRNSAREPLTPTVTSTPPAWTCAGRCWRRSASKPGIWKPQPRPKRSIRITRGPLI